MRKPGRPAKNGVKPLDVLCRDTVVVYAYSQAREAGEKHSIAMQRGRSVCPNQLPRDAHFRDRSEANRVALAIKAKCNLPFR